MALPITSRWIKDCVPLNVQEGEPAETVDTAISLSVEYLQVAPPPGREGDVCSIYGKLSVGDRFAAPSVTLFNRSRARAETIELDPESGVLTLSDDSSARPLRGGIPIFVKMRLFEKIGDDEDNDGDDGKGKGKDDDGDALPEKEKDTDILIADIDFEFKDFYEVDERCYFEFEGQKDFLFYLAYANINLSAFAEVEVTINKEIIFPSASASASDPSNTTTSTKRKLPIQPNGIYGIIAAVQHIRQPYTPAIQLYNTTADDPTNVDDIGTSSIPLDRKLVVASTGAFAVAFHLYNAATQELIAEKSVCFSIGNSEGYIRVPKDLTYTQKTEDGLISVSITFVPYKSYPFR